MVAVLGTAAVNTSSLRMSGLNYRAYSLLRGFLPVNLLPSVNQNVLGGFLATFLPLSLGFVVWSRNWWLKLYAGGCSIVIGGALVVTSSRGALLGLVGAVGVFGWFWLASRSSRLKRLLTLPALALTALTAVVGLLEFTDISNGLNRLELWRSTLALIGDYPLTGAGLGQFQNRIGAYASPYIYGQLQPHAHNLFLQAWVEFGLFGLAAIGLSLIITLRLLVRYANLNSVESSLRPVVVGSLAGMMALFVNGLVEYGSWGRWFTPAFWLLPALLSAASLTLPTWQVNLRPARFNRLLLIAGSVLVSLGLVLPFLLLNTASLLRPSEFSQSLYRATSLLMPYNAAPERNLGQLAEQHGDKTAVTDYYQQATEHNADDWLSLLALARLSQQRGDSNQALTYWRKAGAAPYLRYQAELFLQQTPPDYATAEQTLLTALSLEPTSREAETTLVGIYNTTGRTKEALALIQKLLSNHPDPQLLVQAANLTTDNGQRIELLLQATGLNPQSAEPFWELANAYVSQKQNDLAEKAYQQALQIKPGFQWPIRSLAQLYLDEGRFNDSLNLLESFLAKKFFIESPEREYILLSQTYLALQKPTAAIEASRTALSYNPSNPTALLIQGDAYLATGDKTKAREAYQKVLQLEPTNTAAKQHLETIGQ